MATIAGTSAQIGEIDSPRLSVRKLMGAILGILVPGSIWMAPLGLGLREKHAFAVSAFMIIAWITEVLPHALTGLVGCYLFWVLKVVNFSVAFGGFADQTPWFLFGAGLLGMVATKSGLARRLAYLVMRRIGGGYSRLVLGLILSSFLLTFLVPSGIACVVIMAAVALGLMEVFQLGRGTMVGRGIFITLTYTAGIFDKMVIAGPASILGRGLIEKGTNAHLYWSLWFLAFLPCALATMFFTWRLVLWLYPPEKEALGGGIEFLDAELKKIGLWVTDLVHHISPAIIGIGVGLLAAVPRLGVLDEKDLKRYNYLPIIFVAAAISMGDVLLSTNALEPLTVVMFDWMRPLLTNVFALAVVPYWTAFVYHIFLGNEISMLATSVPPLMRFAAVSGIHAVPLGLVWAFAAGGKIFVYQSGVMVAGYSYGYFEMKDMLRVGICLSIFESLALLVLVPFYWPLIGIR